MTEEAKKVEDTITLPRNLLQEMVNILATLPWAQANPILVKLEAYLRETEQS